MKRTRFSKTQIFNILKKAEAGITLTEIQDIAKQWFEEHNAIQLREISQGWLPYLYATEHA